MKRTLAGFLLVMLCGMAFAGGGKEDKKAAAPGNRGQNIRPAVLAPDGLNFTDGDQYFAFPVGDRL